MESDIEGRESKKTTGDKKKYLMKEEIKAALISGIFSLLAGAITTFGVTTTFNSQNVNVVIKGEEVTITKEENQKIFDTLSSQNADIIIERDNLRNDNAVLSATNTNLVTELDKLKNGYDVLLTANADLSNELNKLKNLYSPTFEPTPQPTPEPDDRLVVMPDVVPAYAIQGRYDEYSIKKNTKTFSIGGTTYKNALHFYCWWTDDNLWAAYNLNNEYSTFSGTLAWVPMNDSHYVTAGTMSFFGDGKLLAEEQLTIDMLPKELDINVSGINQLKIVLVGDDSEYICLSYGIGNPMLKKTDKQE